MLHKKARSATLVLVTNGANARNRNLERTNVDLNLNSPLFLAKGTKITFSAKTGMKWGTLAHVTLRESTIRPKSRSNWKGVTGAFWQRSYEKAEIGRNPVN